MDNTGSGRDFGRQIDFFPVPIVRHADVKPWGVRACLRIGPSHGLRTEALPSKHAYSRDAFALAASALRLRRGDPDRLVMMVGLAGLAAACSRILHLLTYDP